MKITQINTQFVPPSVTGTVKKMPSQPTPPNQPKCLVQEQPDGAMNVNFLIDPQTAERLRKRAYLTPLDRYIWEQILRPAVEGHCW